MESFSWGSKTDANSWTDSDGPEQKSYRQTTFQFCLVIQKVDTLSVVVFKIRFFFAKLCLPSILKECTPLTLCWQTTFSSLGHVSNMSTYYLVDEKKVIVVLKMPVNDGLTLSIFILYVFNVGERILSTILVHTMYHLPKVGNPSSGKGGWFSRVRWCFFRVFLWKIKQKKGWKMFSLYSLS